MTDHTFRSETALATPQVPETQFPAHVYRKRYTHVLDLAPLNTAQPGDVIAMVSGYKAAFEDRPDLSRHLEGFYVAGDPSPAFVFFENLTGEPRDMAARIALTNLYLNSDVHWEAVDWNMVECELCYQINVVTFADARVLFNIDMLRDPLLISEAVDDIPDFAPCVIEIFGDHDEFTCVAIAARYLELVRNLLPAHERPAPGFCDLQFRA